MKKAVIIIPTYNERENIEQLILRVREVFANMEGYRLHTLVVDDYSPDKTSEVVSKLAKKYKDITLISKEKEGLGAAYVFGMNYAIAKLSPDILVQMDADWSHDPGLLPKFVEQIEAGADFVIGSRYIRGGSIPGNWGWQRKLYSVTGNLIVRTGMGAKMPHDWTSGYRMMRASIYSTISEGLEKYSGYTFQVAFLHRVQQAGYKIAEVPLKFIDRAKGKSKIAPLDYISNLMLYVITNSTLVKYLLVGFTGFGIQTAVFELLNAWGVFPGISVVFGACCAIIANFFGNNLWTFRAKRIFGLKKLFKKFTQFFTTSIGAIVIQSVVVSIAVTYIGDGVRLPAMMFAIIFLVIPYNFFIYNKFIWKAQKK